MAFLANFRVLTKILSIIILMAAVAATIAFIDINSLKSLDEKPTT